MIFTPPINSVVQTKYRMDKLALKRLNEQVDAHRH